MGCHIRSLSQRGLNSDLKKKDEASGATPQKFRVSAKGKNSSKSLALVIVVYFNIRADIKRPMFTWVFLFEEVWGLKMNHVTIRAI